MTKSNSILNRISGHMGLQVRQNSLDDTGLYSGHTFGDCSIREYQFNIVMLCYSCRLAKNKDDHQGHWCKPSRLCWSIPVTKFLIKSKPYSITYQQ